MRPNIDAAKHGCAQAWMRPTTCAIGRAYLIVVDPLSLIHLALQPVHSLKLLMVLMLRAARIQVLAVNFL
jgi:hypothetical protein